MASEEVAEVLEKLGTIAQPVQVRSLRQSDQLKQVRHARTCYDHVAGELGVKIADSLVEREMVHLENGEYIVTEQGKMWFRQFGIQIEEAYSKRRAFAKPCLDWSERRYHISGWLGAAITRRFVEQEWMIREEKNRAITLTRKGIEGLREQFGIVLMRK